MIEHRDLAFAGPVRMEECTVHVIGSGSARFRERFSETKIGSDCRRQSTAGTVTFDVEFRMDEFVQLPAIIESINHLATAQMPALEQHGADAQFQQFDQRRFSCFVILD